MAPSQYIAVPHCSSTFPLHGYFVESKRWGDRKTPKLFVGSTIAFGGFIDKIRQERDIDCTVAAVNIEVITIAFLPTHTTFQSNPSSQYLDFYLFLILTSFSTRRPQHSIQNITITMELSKPYSTFPPPCRIFIQTIITKPKKTQTFRAPRQPRRHHSFHRRRHSIQLKCSLSKSFHCRELLISSPNRNIPFVFHSSSIMINLNL